MPLLIFEIALPIRTARVFTFFPLVTQQIHSLRASGVMFSQSALTLGFEYMAFLKSAGSLCTRPGVAYNNFPLLASFIRVS
jgi:hypothetical protein